MIQHPGNVFVVSAPSGAGKSTLAQRLVQSVPDLSFSISFTTRKPRPGEVDGRDYFFIDDDRFETMVREDGFVEWVQVYGHRYGTGRAWLNGVLATGRDVLLDIETTGALNLRRAIPDARMIFILPPSAAALERRLRSRGKDTDEQIGIRLRHARHELELYHAYDYLILNDDLELAYQQLESIVYATRASRERMAPVAQRILEGF
ncbi:guanylate kinase [Geothrix limicola]|uniref:Guanylate kinase n=1 Tax=Geothrix limicola TaxID=2927978 RepID=A0ABQ5QFK2_9BACT|nr:guanylate kinase [Geothrix limicola]GLH73369.1 guanylate kinase [Geothrix limicola]